jgi:hypothetical protein
VTITVDSDSADFLDQVRSGLPHGSVVVDDEPADVHYEATTTAEGLHLTIDGWQLRATPDLDGLLGAIDFSVGKRAPDHVFVHAGVVAWNNLVVVVPGRSRAGKTSIVRALVDAGALYLSDEYAAIDEQGLVHPYPRPLGVRQPDGTSRRISVQTLGGVAATEPLPVALVLATRYRPGAEWTPQRDSRASGLLALLDNTLSVREHPRRTLAFLGKAVAGAMVLNGVRGDAETIAPKVIETVEELATTGKRSRSRNP